MAHLTARGAYGRLVERLNRFPQGAPPSEALYAILRLLFSEEEAGLVALLPIRPFTARRAASAWKRTESEARLVLDRLCGRGILLDIESPGGTTYVLPPPMAGFFEFSMMRVREDLDQRLLAELFYQYLNVEDEFILALFCGHETHLGRVFVHEPALTPETSLHVLDYERASQVVRDARHRAVSLCYCRHKMAHVGRACDAPLEICLTFNNVARSLGSRGICRLIDEAEAMDLLRQAWERGLVQFGENVREQPSFICNCCSCCCEALIAHRRFAVMHPVHTTGVLPAIDEAACNGCGKCADACPAEAMALVSAHAAHGGPKRKAALDSGRCLGCLVCVRACPKAALSAAPRGERVLTPVNAAHKYVLMAIERGQLQNLVFDQQALWNHRVMAAILGVILRLPPIRQALASRQLKSRYLEWAIRRTAA